MKTEEELVKEIEDAVGKLNSLLYEACAGGVEVQITQNIIATLGYPIDNLLLDVTIKKVLNPRKIPYTGVKN